MRPPQPRLRAASKQRPFIHPAQRPPRSIFLNAGSTVLKQVRSAALARTEARLDIRAWKDDANAVRMANHGELLALAARTGRNKDWVEAFFLSARNAPVELDETPEGETSEDEPPTG